jgi:hypothetical protein
MIHIISFQNMPKNFAEVSVNNFKNEFFQTQLTWGSYVAILTTDDAQNISHLF